MLARLYPTDYILKHPHMGLLLGFLFSIIGIALAVILFKQDPALVTVAFIALLLYPTINAALEKERKNIEQNKMKKGLLFKMHRRVLTLYLFIFIGVLLGFSLFSLLLPSLATNALFENQINVLYGNIGNAATFNQELFTNLFTHNLKVMALAFATALLIGDGAIFLLVWNASVWGTIFGNLAATSASSAALNPFIIFALILLIVLPHLLLEAAAYIFAATSGGVTSNILLKGSKKHSSTTLLIRSLAILGIGIVVLAVGMFIEQYVLTNSELYRAIISLSGLI